jgi:Spy/CpxP family protein refolding chaperone
MKRSLAVVFLLITSIVAFAQPPGGSRMRERFMEHRERLKEDLHLTDQQETQVKKLHLELERKQAQLQSKVRLARLDMKEIYLSDKIDRAAIEKAIKQVSDLQHQLKMNFVDFWFSVNGILTPEQQRVWKNHVGQMAGGIRDRMRQRLHKRMGMPDGPDDDDDR